jgi:hypothetical protein
MKGMRWILLAWMGVGLSLWVLGCGSGGSTPPPANYTLTVNSTNPASGVVIPYQVRGNSSSTEGTTSFTLAEPSGTFLTLVAPVVAGNNQRSGWTGCDINLDGGCSVTMNSNRTVTANYTTPAVTVTPNPATATIGSQVQFAAQVNGVASTNVTWSVTISSGSTLTTPGTISSTGLYTTPYPAPTSVTVTATSTQGATTGQTGSTTVTLSAPAASAGPALNVNVLGQTHAINPFIYGWNGYASNAAAAQAANITVDRFGGDATSLYNYQLDVTNAGSDWYFENSVGATGVQATGQFNQQVIGDAAIGAKTLGTMPVEGYVAKDGTSCSYPKSTFPQQFAFDPYNNPNCGDGLYPDGVSGCTSASGCNIPDPANEASVSATPAGPAWDGAWVAYLVKTFGTAANGGVYSYDLDNEPAWWDGGHRDVHPLPSTYDEVTDNGIATAQAIKAADPTARVNGPVVDFWWNYFYSKKDIENGWSNGNPCWEPWSNPIDRKAHGGVPFIEYYLQQFAAASNTSGVRLLDYLDLHTYFAATYNGSGVGLTTAGDTGEQQARLNSTRVFWDPTYTDSNFPQPNYSTDSNYTSSCSTPLQAPQLIPMAQGWVAKNYPGTKVAFTEYNWGGQENINGAVAQADILGIFGAYGLDMATLWGPPDPTKGQVPGLMAYEIYRNYDGKNSKFGDISIPSTSANQGQLSVYSAERSTDNALTVVVINKTYGDLTSTVALNTYLPNSTSVQAYLYSNANLNAIVGPTAVTVTNVSGQASTISNYTFPAQSITLFVVPQ